MINPNSFEAANSYIVSQLKHYTDGQKSAKKPSHPFVTISREAGAGGTIIGEKLIEFLNLNCKPPELYWTLFDKNLIELVIEEHHLPDEFRHYISETKVSELQSVLEQISGLHPSSSKLMKKTCHTILNLAILGYVVIIGRGANILTRSLSGGFHIRLIADTEWKIRNVENNLNLNRKESIKYIENEECNRREYVKKLFNKNIDDNLLYDLIINTSKITVDSAVKIIGAHIKRKTED